ncbi:tyrosine-protein phosphatase YwqE [Dyadobacter jejuensis]|uniref:protein-tyrosine-phosphatase n=1 Tax=Dyadobacter jejuensis TaxID=1082580 RepID=A0A316B0H0_9BACT|nr:CpsB/CapC family capsule biosynthesis tyrosine phosphatase [Dyadobacter jejuensis]PWJ55997.1 tyrosine-protein phosphatase YwqE [Dyadobacter jejuensis]
MFNWIYKKSKETQLDLSHIGIDLHSHLIPGIDDGVETIEEALEMIRFFQSLGYQELYTTPHIIWDCYRNTPEIIRSGLEEVRSAARAEDLQIRINAAAEYFIDEHFMDLLLTGQEMLTLPGNRLLVELPYSTPLLNTAQTLFTIIEKGYKPVLAHPERYTYYYSDPSIYQQLCAQGCELQVNALSLGPYYGENVQKMATWLLKNNLITFLGSDAHKIQHLQQIGLKNKQKWLREYPFKNEKLLHV